MKLNLTDLRQNAHLNITDASLLNKEALTIP